MLLETVAIGCLSGIIQSMKVAIAICTCNREGALSAALQSCLAQSSKAAQIVIIDDGHLSDEFVTKWSEALAGKNINLIYPEEN